MMTPEQCRAARAWLNWSQEQLASNSNVALSTVRSFEKAEADYEPMANNIAAMQTALERGGIEFTSAALEFAGVKFRSRIKEADTYLPIMDLLDSSPDGFMKTSDIIRGLEAYFRVAGEDAEILENRSDTKFSQIVRNVISHKTSPSNLIGMGLAVHEKARKGLRITQAGREAVIPHQPLKTSL